MSTTEVSPPAGGAQAIHAPRSFLKFGEGVSKHFNFTKHVAIAVTAGVGLGLVWKTWHWNEKRFIAQYYSEVAQREAKEESERRAAIEAKFKELEEALSQ